jgi:hypothetical protein
VRAERQSDCWEHYFSLRQNKRHSSCPFLSFLSLPIGYDTAKLRDILIVVVKGKTESGGDPTIVRRP